MMSKYVLLQINCTISRNVLVYIRIIVQQLFIVQYYILCLIEVSAVCGYL